MTSPARPADPAEQRKPLVLLESWPSTQIVATRLVKPPASLLALAESVPSAERCFRRLVQDGERQTAVRFLAAALRRRVQVWWGYLCVHEVVAQARANRAHAAAAGGGGGAGGAAAGLPVVSPDLGLDIEAFKAKPPVEAGICLTDPAAWPKPSLGADGRLNFLPKGLEALRDDPRRRPDACDRFFAQRQAFIERLPPAERSAFLAEDATSGEQVARVLGRPVSELMALDRDQALRRSGLGLDADPQAPHNQLRAALAAKKAEIEAAIASGMDRLKAALAHLPKGAPLRLGGDSPEAEGALRAARTWILNPCTENGRAAMAAGEACQDLDQAAGCIAMACHFSSTDLAPAEAPAEAPVPPPPATAPTMVATALELARSIPDSGRTPEQWLDRFLELGVEVAQGVRTWDELLRERQSGPHPWAGRAGFGRQVAKPEPPRPDEPQAGPAPKARPG